MIPPAWKNLFIILGLQTIKQRDSLRKYQKWKFLLQHQLWTKNNNWIMLTGEIINILLNQKTSAYISTSKMNIWEVSRMMMRANECVDCSQRAFFSSFMPLLSLTILQFDDWHCILVKDKVTSGQIAVLYLKQRGSYFSLLLLNISKH